MKRAALIAVLLCLAATAARTQKATTPVELTDKQWQELLKALGDEDWDASFELSARYIELLKDSDEAKGVPSLRYMHLYSAAGRVSKGKMSYDELEKDVKRFVGKRVVFPYRRVALKCGGAFHVICRGDSDDKGVVAATNMGGTVIHSFDYIQFREPLDFAKHDGEEVSVGGVIKAIVPNPNRTTLVIMRIFVTDAFFAPAPRKALTAGMYSEEEGAKRS